MKFLNQNYKQFVYFSIVGSFGFLVDTTVLYLIIYGFEGGLYTARVFSYLFAATSTWWLNRIYTFNSLVKVNYFTQWLKFIWLNTFGGMINYVIYGLTIAYWPTAFNYPVIAVAFGSIAGLMVNFSLSKQFVFKKS